MTVTLAGLAFAPFAGAAASSPAHTCLQPQYHADAQAQSALRLEQAVRAGHAVSRIKGIQILLPTDDLIMTKKCRSIAASNASWNQGFAGAYSPPEVASNSVSQRTKAQYQARQIRYQPPIATVATKSAQAGESLRDTRLMIRIGLLLGVAYLGFLTLWFWATRVRPRPTRARRGIDRGRRIK